MKSVVFQDRLTLKQAAKIAGRSPETIAGWAKRHEIGKQLDGRWAIDPLGLAIVMAADGDALKAYKGGARAGPLINPYLSE